MLSTRQVHFNRGFCQKNRDAQDIMKSFVPEDASGNYQEWYQSLTATGMRVLYQSYPGRISKEVEYKEVWRT